jgi:nucleoside-diphosphate-sugar epimerase
LTDRGQITDALRDVELVVHCASIHPWKSYADDQYIDVNVKGNWHLYSAAAEAGIDKIVLTSSIVAAGCVGVPVSAWPVAEDARFSLGDIYAYTKCVQEETARLHADAGRVRTLALRPPAFMPRPELDTGFALTGAFALVEDMVSAHVAAVEVMLGQRRPQQELAAFEAIYTTNDLPYTTDDAESGEDGDLVPALARKHWPEAYDWLVSRGYGGAWLPAVFDLSKAKRILGWQPQFNFDWWFREHGGD